MLMPRRKSTRRSRSDRGAWALAAALAAGVAAGAPAPAAAHPHMFFDAQAAFVFDEAGRLSGVRVAFVVDEFNTLYTLTELGFDADGDGALTEAEAADLAGRMMMGLSDYDYFTDLRLDEERVALDAPRDAIARLEDGVIGASFFIPLAEPSDPTGKTTVLKLYDPTYFTEVTMAAEPTFAGAKPDHCLTGLEPFDASAKVAQLQAILLQLSREETPEIENIGSVFADKATLSCGA